MLAFLIDQDTRVEGAYVDFFGRPAYTPTGVASLALHRDIPVVMGYSHRLEDGRHRIVFKKPLTLVRTGQSENDINVNTAIFTKYLEEFISMRPEQWVWMHRRWGKRLNEKEPALRE
jgi:KDO2-lipid IV(A) lauroyltransferase